MSFIMNIVAMYGINEIIINFIYWNKVIVSIEISMLDFTIRENRIFFKKMDDLIYF